MKYFFLLYIISTIFQCQVRAQQYARYSILISEIFPDPNPTKGLPAFEFIELTNTSARVIDLYEWSLSNDHSFTTITHHYLLLPDSMVIICSTTGAKDYLEISPCIGTSGFISIDNTSGRISLYNDRRQLIHSVGYDKRSYGNIPKSEGGWTLEMIDLSNPCGDANNWRTSNDPSGGTPGRINSVAADNPDIDPPELLRSYASDTISIVAVFSESLDSIAAADNTRYILSGGIQPEKAIPQTPAFNEVLLKFSTPIKPSVYSLTVNKVTDCTGNTIGIHNSCLAGIGSVAEKNDLVINEILFNPKPGCFDYIEIYNRSKKIIDLDKIYLSGKSISGNPLSSKPFAASPFLLFPGECFAVTEDAASLPFCYHVKDPRRIAVLSSLPTLPDDKGSVMITTEQGLVIDALDYDNDWHFPLITDDDGVALERINYDAPTQQKDNWISASSSSGFGTPGYINSQYRGDLLPQGIISLAPMIFSPDNDGFDDFIEISYKADRPGYMGSVIVFDEEGRKVRILANNALLGISEFFRWDGLNENKRPLSPGIYIIMVQIFNLQGRTKKFLNAVTLAKRF